MNYSSKSEHAFAIKISIVFAVVLLVFLVIIFLGAYKYEKLSMYGANIYSFLPFSAAKVDGDGVNLGKYNQNYKSIRKFYETNDFSSVDIVIDFEGEDGNFYDMDIKRSVMSRMIDDLVAKKLLKEEYGIELDKKEMRKDFESILIEYGSAKNTEAELKRLYGWDLDDFLKKVVEPQMHMDELKKRVASDEDIEQNRLAKDNALDTLSRLKNGEDFAEVAKQLSEGESAALGGDLGFFSKGVMVPEFEEVAFSLNEGEVSNIVKSRYGYHIIKVEEKKGDEIRARHILFRTKNFDDWFEEKKAEMDIQVKVDGLKYDKNIQNVIFENDEYNERLAETEKRIKEEFESQE